MNVMKKAVAVLTIISLLGCASSAQAASVNATTINTGGYGYQEARRAPTLGPALALATIALVTVIIIALQKQDGAHSHSSSS